MSVTGKVSGYRDLHAGESGAQAEVDAVAEGAVSACGRAVQAEVGGGVAEHGLVEVRGHEPDDHPAALVRRFIAEVVGGIRGGALL